MNFVFDIETSGLVRKKDAHYHDTEAFDTARIVSICWLLTQGDRIMEQSYFVIKPDGFQISPGAQEVHGISYEMAVNDGVPIQEMFAELLVSLEHVHSMISYNINFDVNVLRSELYRYGCQNIIEIINAKKHICCMLKAKEFLRCDKFPKLADAYQKICMEELKNAHHAMSDSISCLKLYNKMFPMSRDIFFVKNKKVELTPEQSTIVFAPLTMNIAVLASAGSGKTTVITARIKHLIESGVPSGAILLTTFTRDSANDMRQKLLDILGYKPDTVIGTIDTIAKVNTYYAKSESKRELKDVGEHAKDYLDHIRKNPTTIKMYKYMFIDEFQDINNIQFEIIQEFAKNGSWIFVVGDDHQNIYTFRGSSIEYILNFKTYFRNNSDMFKLTFNFRSTREIIAFANASISNNVNQIPKVMVPGIPHDVPSPKPEIRYFETSGSQNSHVVKKICELVRKGVILDEIAVLSPLNQSLFLIEEMLIKAGIKTVYLDGKSDVRTIKKSGHVCLCTIHKAKGLEWEHVFLTNMSDELMPKLKSPQHIEESRRLFYVAITRAKHALYITYTAKANCPYITRFISEIPVGLYDFVDFKDEYTKGTSENEVLVLDKAVTSLIENLDGTDYSILKERGIMPVINTIAMPKLKLYEPYDYIPLIVREELYTDFGNFVDNLISRDISLVCQNEVTNQACKCAIQTLSCLILEKPIYSVYTKYRSNFIKNVMNVTSNKIYKVIATLTIGVGPIAQEDVETVYEIYKQLKSQSEKYEIAIDKVPVFHSSYLPNNFVNMMESCLAKIKSNCDTLDSLDELWETSKCSSIIRSNRRRLLYMDVKPNKHMQNYIELFKNIKEHFVNMVLGKSKGDVKVHEELCLENGVYGELDLRVDDMIIDYKCTINDDITAQWLLQLLCYKALYDLTYMEEKQIKVVGVFNPLRGWWCPIDVSSWDKQNELLEYLLEKREKLFASSKH